MGAAELPKPGLSVITVRKSVYEVLFAQAKARGQSISQYLESALQSEQSPGVRTVLGQSQIAQNSANPPQGGGFLVRPPGFEPGFPALSVRQWEAGVIDQVARQLSKVSADSGPRPLIGPSGQLFLSVFTDIQQNCSCRFVRFNYLRYHLLSRYL